MEQIRLRGTISSAAFSSGDGFVVGHWRTTPIGPFGDVMWRRPTGERVLLAPSDEVATLITNIYSFDDVVIDNLVTTSDGASTTVTSPRLSLALRGGRLRPIPFPRPLAITRFIERPIARRLMGVETYGTTSRGVSEWYQARGWRWVTSGSATLDGADLGLPVEFTEPLNVGFSEPPARPSIVQMHVTIATASVL